MRTAHFLAATVLWAALPPSTAAAECANRKPERQALFGDLHVHTSLSSDAWMFDVRVRPDDAYRYAFGGSLRLPPNDAEGRGLREVRIDRPLDFAAVTDHAEFLGEGVICIDPEAEGYDSSFCETFRAGEGRSPRLVFQIFNPFPWRDGGVCGDDGERCRAAASGAWQEIIAAAETWNDTSPACRRTAFVAYEYSSFRLGSNLHRNVIFRNATVPSMPTSHLDAPREWELWNALERDCLEKRNGCDVLAIPHNSNISNGRMFQVDYPRTGSIQQERARAAQRARLEPVVEIMQHKGDSECRNGLSGVLGGEDELCGFEKFEDLAFSRWTDGDEQVGDCYAGPLADYVPHLGPNCLSRMSYVRYALVEGLREEARLGVNPHKFGISASTDTHNGLAGGVEERSYPGHLGTGDDTPGERVRYDPEIPGNAANNPGGLFAVYSEENSRESIFDAIRRREVYGTSGPRMELRFFGGWGYPDPLCEDRAFVSKGYAGGVPMGGDLPRREDGSEPVFAVAALRDPGTPEAPGGLLQRLQIVKGWADSEGNHHQRIYDVAGTAENGAGVDPATCRPRGSGADRLCSVWRDPDFEVDVPAVYYARAVENPSCRYGTWQCLGLRGDDRPADCDTPATPKLIQERAWSSPIWYTPAAGKHTN